MAFKASNFRENPKRAIFVVGEINQPMVDRLTPAILNLRAESSEPITVYIDSLGGSTFHARLLIYLLTTRNQDGERCRIITVVTGTAASAGADILAAGDYAIAYRHAIIHYHGVRTSLGDITHESASSLAEALKQSNEGFALELAERMKKRFFFIYTQLSSGFHAVRNGNAETSIVECLARCMSEKLSGSAKLLEVALEKHQRLNSLLSQYNENLRLHGENFARSAEKEAFLIKFLVDWEMRENVEALWRFGPKGITAIREDFILLADFEDGQHMRDLDSDINEWGMFLLEGDQQQRYRELDGDEATAYLKEQTKDRFRAVWHFLVSVCRALQQGENRLTPYEAYWLGLIDEIPGSALSNIREMFENYQQAVEAEELEKAAKRKAGKAHTLATTGKKKATKVSSRKALKRKV